jgi:hypothetical protein
MMKVDLRSREELRRTRRRAAALRWTRARLMSRVAVARRRVATAEAHAQRQRLDALA